MLAFLEKTLCWATLIALTTNVAMAQSSGVSDSHEAAITRLAKALRVEDGFARGMEDGVRRVASRNPAIVEKVIDCVKSNHMEQKLFSEWIRVHRRHISKEDATGIASYFQSSGGLKLILGLRACSSSPQGAIPCNPLITLNERDRMELATFEKSAAAVTLNRVQPIAQREFEGSSQSLVAAGIDICMRAPH
jgi:hypothetical protein